jgi:hypothetical protein
VYSRYDDGQFVSMEGGRSDLMRAPVRFSDMDELMGVCEKSWQVQ